MRRFANRNGHRAALALLLAGLYLAGCKPQAQVDAAASPAMSQTEKIIVTEPAAGSPIGPYSQAVRTGNLLFVSGQIGLDPATGELKGPDFEDEARQMMTNLEAILRKAGSGFDHVVKSTIYIRDMGQFAQLNQLYGGYFTAGNYPARETVEVSGLPKNARCEISVVAIVP